MATSYSWTLVDSAIPLPAESSAEEQLGYGSAQDIALDAFGDLLFTDGDLSFVRGAEAVQQSLKIRLRFFQGEWFLDVNAGLPYSTQILVKNPNLVALRAIYRREIEETVGVGELRRLLLTYDPARILKVQYSVVTDLGELIEAATEVNG